MIIREYTKESVSKTIAKNKITHNKKKNMRLTLR